MVAIALKQDSRLNVRLKPDIKARIERAAVISGKTVTDFAIAALAEIANEVLDQDRETKLSENDSKIFLSMLENPPAPNNALRRAAESHKQLIVE